MDCKTAIKLGYCSHKGRDGFCKKFLMGCGDDSIRPMLGPKDKILLKEILINEFKIKQKKMEEFI